MPFVVFLFCSSWINKFSGYCLKSSQWRWIKRSSKGQPFSRAVSTSGEVPWQSWRGREPVLLSLTRAVARFVFCLVIWYQPSSLFVMMFLCLVLKDEWKWSMSWKCKSGKCCKRNREANQSHNEATKTSSSLDHLPLLQNICVESNHRLHQTEEM